MCAKFYQNMLKGLMYIMFTWLFLYKSIMTLTFNLQNQYGAILKVFKSLLCS